MLEDTFSRNWYLTAITEIDMKSGSRLNHGE
jgi:hypothetical protein